MKHTPGPWKVEKWTHGESGIDQSYISADAGWAKGNRTVAIVGHWLDRPDPEADARLIAKAPEMYAALKGIVEGKIAANDLEQLWRELFPERYDE